MATLHRVFKGLDVAAFEAEVGNWLANSGVEADDPLSLDGKTLRGVHGQEIPGVHLVSAYASRAGAVLAQVAGKGEELAAVKEVLGQVPLKGRVVVADALLGKSVSRLWQAAESICCQLKRISPPCAETWRWLFPR